MVLGSLGKSKGKSLKHGSRVAVIGGGPAGSFFAYFLLQLSDCLEADVCVDVFEGRDFSVPGPVGCNMCAGAVPESLLRTLAIEGINLPNHAVQRSINSFVVHAAGDSATMHTPLPEMKIATVYRGSGPRSAQKQDCKSFDAYLLDHAISKGANLIRRRVEHLRWRASRPQVHVEGEEPRIYDLVVGAMGVNAPTLSLFENLGIGYRRPKVKKTYIAELTLGSDIVKKRLGNSLHAFFLDIPGLEFGVIVPKNEHATMCLIGNHINRDVIEAFMEHQTVRQCLSAGKTMASVVCSCSPVTSVGDPGHPFGDRVVMIGDCGVSRLYKDGIRSAYRTAKAAAVTAISEGVSANDFRAHYWPVCQSISRDNRFGRIIYGMLSRFKRTFFLIHSVVRMANNEQSRKDRKRRMTMLLWDMLTGSTSYKDLFLRSLSPAFLGIHFWNIVAGFLARSKKELTNASVVVKKGEAGMPFNATPENGSATAVRVARMGKWSRCQ
jgi:flavin-dependent dehydrogenase